MNLKHILKVTGSIALSALMATASIPVSVYAEENTSSKTNESLLNSKSDGDILSCQLSKARDVVY